MPPAARSLARCHQVSAPGCAQQLRRHAAPGRWRARRVRQRAIGAPGSCRGPGAAEGCSTGSSSGRAPSVSNAPGQPPTLPPSLAPPLRAAPAAPRSCQPTAGGFAGRGSRLDAAVRAVRAGEARESFSGRVRAPPARETAPRCSGFRTARAGGGNLPEERRRAKAAPGARRSPRSSSPPRRAPAPALPEPGARSSPPP